MTERKKLSMISGMNTLTATVIKPKIRGFICVTTHPTGCAKNVQDQIAYVKHKGTISNGPKNVLVIGSSTGYGLASRIAAAFGCKAKTIGVYYERAAENGKAGTAGYYNTLAFDKAAAENGLYAKGINGDAFSDEIKEQTIKLIKSDLGQIDAVIYSLASPRRSHPKTAVIHTSALKPIGRSFTAKTLDTDKDIVKEITIEAANEQEINDTMSVMGSEDWRMWIDALLHANVLAPNVMTIAYTYIGPEVTWPIYRDGTIGRAKKDLEAAVPAINEKLKKLNGRALISVNKALVTQASSAIPVVPLYVSLLYKIMKEKGTHEGCIEQMYRLFANHLYNNQQPKLDDHGRIRIDDLEMDPVVQEQIKKVWTQVTTENIKELSDLAGYKAEFLKLFGFGLPDINYDEPVNIEV
jgi:enoyl-[acyl-carrier protein] reductase / trans-2-enoyl-CoA reductase (NAD+)